jgi:hypothetical protein
VRTVSVPPSKNFFRPTVALHFAPIGFESHRRKGLSMNQTSRSADVPVGRVADIPVGYAVPRSEAARPADHPAGWKTFATSPNCRCDGAVHGLDSLPGSEMGSTQESVLGGSENCGGKSSALGAIGGGPDRHGSPGGSPYHRSFNWRCHSLNINNPGRARLLPSRGRFERQCFREGEANKPSAGPGLLPSLRRSESQTFRSGEANRPSAGPSAGPDAGLGR